MRERGFTLLEVIVAVAIFAFVAAVAGQTMANASYQSVAAQRARELRMLGEWKLGEVLTFEYFYDELNEGDFGDYGENWREWEWSLDIRDVTVFGESAAEDAEYLFGKPEEDEEETVPAPGAETQKKGENQVLRELTLRITAPADEGDADTLELITFMPLVEHGKPVGKPK